MNQRRIEAIIRRNANPALVTREQIKEMAREIARDPTNYEHIVNVLIRHTTPATAKHIAQVIVDQARRGGAP